MELKSISPTRHEFVILAVLLMLFNAIAIIFESTELIKWSRFISSLFLLVYLWKKYRIYLKTRFLLGFICILSSDFCLIYFDHLMLSLLFLVFSICGFGLFLFNITKLICWRQVTFLNMVILSILFCFELYLINQILGVVSEHVDSFLLICFYIYTLVTVAFTFVAGLAYLQSDIAGNEHYVIIPYAYMISNVFLGIELYFEAHWSNYLSRAFYIITLCVLSHYIVIKLNEETQDSQEANDSKSF